MAILNKPATIITLFPQLKPRKHIKFPTSKLVFTEELVSHKTVSCNGTAWSLNAVTRSTKGKALAFNDNAGDEGVKDLEQEGFISEFSQFHPECIVANGLESTLNRLSMGIVAVCFSAILLWRHDAEALWATVGFGLNLGLSTMLKEILNQARPVSATRYDPGMPSTHAQSIFFVIMFTVLSMVELLGVNGLAITFSGAVLAFGSYLRYMYQDAPLIIYLLIICLTHGSDFFAIETMSKISPLRISQLLSIQSRLD
ncbi:unnamed protein product [Ilex paraguariensis]|uniref:Phosphatidic acid phosphatase type 2/haloperoxidase domain-containing protein n=1 Tax=Ilex paraguariensis TaxID=185542 RepID=A0ABC8S555_9AQUA